MVLLGWPGRWSDDSYLLAGGTRPRMVTVMGHVLRAMVISGEHHYRKKELALPYLHPDSAS